MPGVSGEFKFCVSCERVAGGEGDSECSGQNVLLIVILSAMLSSTDEYSMSFIHQPNSQGIS